MRDFIDEILAFIDSESMTDDEFSLITVTVQEYTLTLYSELKAILVERESISGQLKKLKSFFEAKGVSLTGPAILPNSNILIGGAL